jgi:imidazolonepropionase-like amidohydrolase
LLVEAGLTPLAALQAGTINAAKALRYDDIGRLEVGATADLLLVGGNPLDNIRHTRSIIAVVQGGKVVKRRTR